MSERRVQRLNSLLKEVISEVIRNEVKRIRSPELVTVTRVDVTKDLHHAKVYISVIGNEVFKSEILISLQAAAGFIAVHSSKKVVMRYFPELKFYLDDSLDKHMRIETLLSEIQQERESREHDDSEITGE